MFCLWRTAPFWNPCVWWTSLCYHPINLIMPVRTLPFSAHINHPSQISAAISQPFPLSPNLMKSFDLINKKHWLFQLYSRFLRCFLREKQLLFQIDIASYSSHFCMRRWSFFYCRRYFKMDMYGAECKIRVSECHHVTI